MGSGIRLGSEGSGLILAVESNSELPAAGRKNSVDDHIGTFGWFRHCFLKVVKSGDELDSGVPVCSPGFIGILEDLLLPRSRKKFQEIGYQLPTENSKPYHNCTRTGIENQNSENFEHLGCSEGSRECVSCS